MLGGTLTASQAQWAIWGLFASNAQNQATFKQLGAGAIETIYLADAETAKSSAFAGLLLYTPIAGTQSCAACGVPQEYIGYSPVPEPGSLLLLGTGLVALAGAMRQKSLKV